MGPVRQACRLCFKVSSVIFLLLCFHQFFRDVESRGALLSSNNRRTIQFGQPQGLYDRTLNTVGFISGGLQFLANSFSSNGATGSRQKVLPGTSYDFIVVGAGTAGATIAARLSEIRDATVLLIEAGGDETVWMDIPIMANLLQFDSNINWQYKTESSNFYCLGMKDHRCKWPRGRVMGGSSTINYMIATRGNKRDYDRWSELGNYGWSWDEVLPYFKKLETMAITEFQNDTRYHHVGGPVNTDYVPFHSPIANAFINAGKEMGWSEVDYNGERQTGFSYIQTNMRDGMRLSSNRAYLDPIKHRKNLFISKNSLVERIIMDKAQKRAVGVKFIKDNQAYRVWARKEVIISAGAINSPQLLMLSGIGPRKHLREIGIEVLKDSPVGENLQDHISFGGLVFLLNQPVGIAINDMIDPTNPHMSNYLINRKGPIATPGGSEAVAFVNVDKPNDPNDYPNIELFFVGTSIGTAPVFRYNVGLNYDFWRRSFSNVNAKYSWTVFPMLMRPKSRGRILLRNANATNHPRIIPNYMNHPEDVRLLVKGIRFAQAVAKTKSMRKFGSNLHNTPISGCQGYKYDSDDYWHCAVRSFTMNIYHYSGTCKMGHDRDPTAVVNPRLQVIGIQGLRVADASVMPEIPTAHTNIPTYMIAEKLSDMVKEDWGYARDPLP